MHNKVNCVDYMQDKVLCVVKNDKYYIQRIDTMWTKPAATEMRFSFEVTMYVMNK